MLDNIPENLFTITRGIPLIRADHETSSTEIDTVANNYAAEK